MYYVYCVCCILGSNYEETKIINKKICLISSVKPVAAMSFHLIRINENVWNTCCKWALMTNMENIKIKGYISIMFKHKAEYLFDTLLYKAMKDILALLQVRKCWLWLD